MKFFLIFILFGFSLNAQDMRIGAVAQSGSIPSMAYDTTISIRNDISGYGEWHWHDVTVTQPISSPDTYMSDNLRASSEMTTNMITTNPYSNRISFHLDPLEAQAVWATQPANKRAEVYLTNVSGNFTAENPSGTEEWLGTDIIFGNDYVVDPNFNFLFMQSKPNDENGYSVPVFSLNIISEGQAGIADGNLALVHTKYDATFGSINTYVDTGIKPLAGVKYEIVLYMKHAHVGGAAKLWVDGVLVADESSIETMNDPSSGAGTIKFGLYKPAWSDLTNAETSVAAGQSKINISFGPLRIDRKFIGDATYGTDKYDLVKPGAEPYTPIVATNVDVTAKIAQGSDDARELDPPGAVTTNTTRIDIGLLSGLDRMNGWRFTEFEDSEGNPIEIPAGVTINSAKIQFTANNGNSSTCQVYITGQKGTNATTFVATNNDLSDRPRTTAKITWVIPAWNQDDRTSAQLTPDLSSIIQEIIDDPSYASTDSMTLFTYNDDEVTGVRNVAPFENTRPDPTNQYAELIINYTD